MKKITFITLCMLAISLAQAQLTSVSIVGSGAGGWPGEPGNPGPVDTHQMTSSDGVHWTLTNLTLTAGPVKFRGNNSWSLPYNWGGPSFPTGTAVVDGGDFMAVAGVYNVHFNSNTLAYSFALVTDNGPDSIALVGSGAGGWPGEAGNPGPVDVHQMGTTDGVNWTLNNLSLSAGAVKLRGNNSWDLPYNWGGSTFPSGTAVVDGDAMTASAGIYNVSFNSETLVYNFVLVSSGISTLAIVGGGAGGWPGEPGNPGPTDLHQMTSTDGENWVINNLPLTVGPVKFRANNSWALPYNWGGSDFPSGIAVVDANGIEVTTAGTYDVTFNVNSKAYSFEISLGIQDMVSRQVTVFPNPSTRMWHISAQQPIVSVMVFDMAGKLVLSQAAGSLQTSVDNTKLQRGLYLATVQTASATTTIKLIKE